MNQDFQATGGIRQTFTTRQPYLVSSIIQHRHPHTHKAHIHTHTNKTHIHILNHIHPLTHTLMPEHRCKSTHTHTYTHTFTYSTHLKWGLSTSITCENRSERNRAAHKLQKMKLSSRTLAIKAMTTIYFHQNQKNKTRGFS
jgi:hypothetical protein